MVLYFIHTEDESRLNSMYISNFVCQLHPPANSKGISLSHLSRQGRRYRLNSQMYNKSLSTYVTSFQFDSLMVQFAFSHI